MEPPGTEHPIRIGRYEVVTHLATGGMAQIYLARQQGLGAFERHVVLKTILPEHARDHRFVTMFLDEAKLAATLNHQNIAQVYEVDHADGAYFMAMEFVHGENARAILETASRRGWTVPIELAISIVSGAAAGLHHAHERRGRGGQPLNIVHRDVSPANVMVGYDGSVKLLDFGIAKAEERATKTVGGTIKGKYGYMSPEQCKGKPLDRRSDIFALGIVLYELSTLRRAFKGADDFDTMKKIVGGELVPPSQVVPGYPPELEAIVRTALAADPAARFQTAAELIEALDAFSVRAKLAGSSSALARYMVQLFGARREPWVAQMTGQEATVVNGEARGEARSEDDERTALIESRAPREATTARMVAATPPPTRQTSPRFPIASPPPAVAGGGGPSGAGARRGTGGEAVVSAPPVPLVAGASVGGLPDGPAAAPVEPAAPDRQVAPVSQVAASARPPAPDDQGEAVPRLGRGLGWVWWVAVPLAALAALAVALLAALAVALAW